MSRKITKLGASLAVLAAVAVGASAIAGAASNTSSSTSTTQAQPSVWPRKSARCVSSRTPTGA